MRDAPIRTCVIYLFTAVLLWVAGIELAQADEDDPQTAIMQRLLANPNFEDFEKLPRYEQLQIIIQSEAGQLLVENDLYPQTYNAMASALYARILATVSPEERFLIDSEVLTQVWLDVEVDELKLARFTQRAFQNSMASAAKSGRVACRLIHASFREIHLAAKSQNTAGPLGDHQEFNQGRTGFERYERILSNETLGAAQHETCHSEHDKDDFETLFDNKSLYELRKLTAEYLKVALKAGKPEISKSTKFARPKEPSTVEGFCTARQIYEVLADGERSVQKFPGSRYHLITNQYGCGIFGELTRDRSGLLRLNLRSFRPNDPSTYQEAYELKTLSEKIYDWQQSQRTSNSKGFRSQGP